MRGTTRCEDRQRVASRVHQQQLRRRRPRYGMPSHQRRERRRHARVSILRLQRRQRRHLLSPDTELRRSRTERETGLVRQLPTVPRERSRNMQSEDHWVIRTILLLASIMNAKPILGALAAILGVWAAAASPVTTSSCVDSYGLRAPPGAWSLTCKGHCPDTSGCFLVEVTTGAGLLDYAYCGCGDGSESPCCHVVLSFDSNGDNPKPEWSGSCHACPDQSSGLCELRLRNDGSLQLAEVRCK